MRNKVFDSLALLLIIISCIACEPTLGLGIIVKNKSDNDIQLTLFRRDSTECKYGIKAHKTYFVEFRYDNERSIYDKDSIYNCTQGSFYIKDSLYPLLRKWWNAQSIQCLIENNLTGILLEYGKENLIITDKVRLSRFLQETHGKGYYVQGDFILKIKDKNIVKWKELYGDTD